VSIGGVPERVDTTTKQVLRLSLTRLLHLSGELARARGGQAVPVAAGGPGSVLIPIRYARTARTPPLFLMHPVGGSVSAYRRLAVSLRRDQPVYAIENQVAFNAQARLYRTIEEMAAAYLQLIQTVQPEGPYQVGGYSMGGLIAFELARQAAARGRTVRLVAIVDTPAQVAARDDGDGADGGLSAREVLTMATVIGRRTQTPLKLTAAELEELDPDERIARLIEALQRSGILPPEADSALFRELVRTIRSNDLAQRRYRPQRYDGDLDLLRASEPSRAVVEEVGSLHDNPTYGWQVFCTRPVRVAHIPGTHLRLMEPPHVKRVAAWLQHLIDERSAVAGPC
jgi:thioesterase domain-containing protein